MHPIGTPFQRPGDDIDFKGPRQVMTGRNDRVISAVHIDPANKGLSTFSVSIGNRFKCDKLEYLVPKSSIGDAYAGNPQLGQRTVYAFRIAEASRFRWWISLSPVKPRVALRAHLPFTRGANWLARNWFADRLTANATVAQANLLPAPQCRTGGIDHPVADFVDEPGPRRAS